MTKQIKQEILRMGWGIILLGMVELFILWAVRGRIGIVAAGVVTGCVTAWLYFFLLGMAVEHPEKRGRYTFLYLLRFAVIGVMTYVVLTNNRFDALAALLPLIFPRILILFRGWQT